jgi:hypothetical protein
MVQFPELRIPRCQPPGEPGIGLRAGGVGAGVENAVTAMAAGRCSVEGDVILAARLETMFGAR